MASVHDGDGDIEIIIPILNDEFAYYRWLVSSEQIAQVQQVLDLVTSLFGEGQYDPNDFPDVPIQLTPEGWREVARALKDEN